MGTDTFTLNDRSLIDRLQNDALMVIVIAIGLLLPFAVETITGNSYGVTLLIELLVFAIAVMSYDLLFGYTGLLSFGHALYFGGGAYIVALVSIHTGLNYYGAVPIALVGVPVLALVTGAISLRLSGVYFAMITLAFGQLGHEIVLQFTDVTGGVNGISAIEIPVLAGFNMTNLYTTYYVILAALIVVYIGLRRLVNSPFGRVIQGIRENPERMRMLGVNVYRYKLASFTIAGFIGGIAGLLYPLYLNFVDPSLVNWTTTGDILIMTLIGGFGTLWGGILGAGFYILTKGTLSSVTDQWRILLGIVFVLFVLFFPSGIAGLVSGDRRTALDIVRQWRSENTQPLRVDESERSGEQEDDQ